MVVEMVFVGGEKLCQFIRGLANQIGKDARWAIVLEYPRSSVVECSVVDKTIDVVGVEAGDSTHACDTRTELNAIT